jgi:hypothetical protein
LSLEKSNFNLKIPNLEVPIIMQVKEKTPQQYAREALKK